MGVPREHLGLATDNAAGRSLVDRNETTEPAVERLHAILRSFGMKLEAAMGPTRVGMSGIPDGPRLVELMREAAAEPIPELPRRR